VVGGRSAGARSAARSAAGLGAVGCLALSFPLHPPGRPEKSRADELETGLPTLVVNGGSDPFGIPDKGPDRTVVVRPGQRHDLRGDPKGLGEIVVTWLAERGWARTPGSCSFVAPDERTPVRINLPGPPGPGDDDHRDQARNAVLPASVHVTGRSRR
jgi:hypothetical protein